MNAKKHLDIDTLIKSQEKAELELERDIPPIALAQARILIERYKNIKVGENWHDDEETEDLVYGMLAELAFADMLYELGIASLYNHVIFQEWVGTKPFDFWIPSVGTLEVKAVLPGEKRYHFLIKKSGWHRSDYAVCLKFESETQCRIIGYLTRKEVEALPLLKFGKEADAYGIELGELGRKRPGKELFTLLEAAPRYLSPKH